MRKSLQVLAVLLFTIMTVLGCGGGGGGGALVPVPAGPSVTSTTPASAATNVAVNAAITATFSEALDPATVTVDTFSVSGVTGSVTYDDVNRTATFTPSSALTYDTVYDAAVTTGVKDLGGRAMAANHAWRFTTGSAPDTTPPTVTATIPANSATGVAVDAALTATFSESMKSSSITTATFQVKDGANNPVAGTVGFNGTTATFTPASSLSFSTTYTATITTGVQDLAGNGMTADYTWAFTAGAAPDITPPLVTSSTPTNNATGVAVSATITATFSESMKPSSITTATFQVKDALSTPVAGTVACNGTTATFTPSSPLADSTTYTATITTGAQDLAGNALASNYAWSFTTAAASVPKGWVWVSGSDTAEAAAAYGAKGVADAANIPGGRYMAAGWKDSHGNYWLLGGRGVDSTGATGILGDLWKFDGTNWTWVAGANVINQQGVYGTRGVPDPANVPGARQNAAVWIDGSDNLWLFGGWGFDTNGQVGDLNDVWKFDGTNWTWVGGDNVRYGGAVYGTKGTPAADNIPGPRDQAAFWTDQSGTFWLFGGTGYDSLNANGELNDVWKFDGTNWTWVAGSKTIGALSVYGTKGTPDAANMPGCRFGSAVAYDGNGNLWLLGGNGPDVNGTNGNLNDLWKFDGTNWTWVAGGQTWNAWGVYGTEGTPAAGNTPGGRSSSVMWTDAEGNVWVFGGNGTDSGTGTGSLNDLWKFDGTNWTWISGADTMNQPGIYGTKGVADAANVPGGRQSAVLWNDGSSGFTVFGGLGADAASSSGKLNDLWRYRP